MIVDPASAPTSGTGGMHTLHLSVAGGLTQFGAYRDTLQPGAWSSFRHWHDSEDEFILVLEGHVTLRDDAGMTDLGPGDAVCWPHGDPNGHHLTNRSAAPFRYLIVGSRVFGDICTYPDDGRRQVNGAARWQIIGADGAVQREGELPPELLNLPPVWGRPFVSPCPNVILAGTIPGESGTSYPGGRDQLGVYLADPLSDAGGISQFGAFSVVLMPGAQNSHRHWHEAEDEFLYVLEGVVTVVENDGPHDLRPGDCACWPKGIANAHCVQNRTDAPIRYFIAGTRLSEDACHYPDIDLHYARRGGMSSMTHKDGRPYPGWPKETQQ